MLENYDVGLPSCILDDNDQEWARFQLDRREPIKLAAMPQHLINAFIAAEDWSFFEHRGISWKGIMRSIMVNAYHGNIVQGASTITQQLVKLLFFDSRKTFGRKLKEQIFACIIEYQCTKEQILETYLNHVYFGCGIYGVQAASQRFWGKDVADITLGQSALLAATVRSPGRYCPILYPLSAKKRRNVILNSMQHLQLITPEQYTEAVREELSSMHDDKEPIAPHLRESLRIFLEQKFGRTMLYSGGLIIKTTLNRAMQQEAEQQFKKQCALLRTNLPGVDGALITIDVKTGGIKALVGGYDFKESQFNRALQAKRQMGSTFKPLIYAAALMQGMSFADTAVDEPIEILQGTRVWRPKNVYDKFGNQMTLAYALSHSNNIVAVKTLLKVGFDPVITLAKKCHITAQLKPLPSLALGCIDVSLQEVAATFNIFAHDGRYVEPHTLVWVKDRWGTKIFKKSPAGNQVVSPSIAGQVRRVLEFGLQRVRAVYPQSWVESQAISKTGTTNDSRTCWYVGSTPDYTTAVYIGLDNNKPMGKDIYPLTTAFPIWLGLMRNIPPKNLNFFKDPGLVERAIHEKTGEELSDKNGPGTLPILVPG